MASTTISLERSAYERLKAEKRPGESFSQVIHRVVGKRSPSLRDFAGLFDASTARDLRAALQEFREEDLRTQERPLHLGRPHGRPRRQ